MSNQAFTPGPWNIHPHYYPIDGEPTKCAEFDAFSISIAHGEMLIGEVSAWKPINGYEMGYPRVENYEEAKANAYLVTAAPELYEALKRCIIALEALYPSRERIELEYEGEQRAVAAVLDSSRAAIAKAEAGQ